MTEVAADTTGAIAELPEPEAELGESVTEEPTTDSAMVDLPLSAAIEAILMVVDEPVTTMTLAQVLQRPVDEVDAEVARLAAEYVADARGFELRQVAGGPVRYRRCSCCRGGGAARLRRTRW